jgi:hypothetical protein
MVTAEAFVTRPEQRVARDPVYLRCDLSPFAHGKLQPPPLESEALARGALHSLDTIFRALFRRRGMHYGRAELCAGSAEGELIARDLACGGGVARWGLAADRRHSTRNATFGAMLRARRRAGREARSAAPPRTTVTTA